MVEWTKEALGLIKSGAYRFFSPSIDWNYRDKATGEPQGATLTSGALTNHPFLEELPPIMLTDLAGSAAIIAFLRPQRASSRACWQRRSTRLATPAYGGWWRALPFLST